jgi:predicted CoA-substrate-specific enzyme activase
MGVLGIDLGSREVKVTLFRNGNVEKMKKFSTVSFYRDYCKFDGKIVVETEKLEMGEFEFGVSTGYGKNNTDIKHFKPINEVKAHIYGVMYQTRRKDFVMLDVGGQDVKVARVEKGLIVDMDLNDKCAASCGRYIENMANVLEISHEEISEAYENPIELNSTCAVFSESELIGKIAQGIDTQVLAASVNYSMFRRLKPLLTGFMAKTLVVTGGVAKNKAIIKHLEGVYKEVIVVENPQYNGSIGCCFYGNMMKKCEMD